MGTIHIFTRKSDLAGVAARCNTSWNQIRVGTRECVDQVLQRWVAIQVLEVPDRMVTHVANFTNHALIRTETALDPEVPLLRIRVMELGPHQHFLLQTGVSSGRIEGRE